jgi:subtilisin family serine protease
MIKLFFSVIIFNLFFALIDCNAGQVKDEYIVKLSNAKSLSFELFFRNKNIGKELRRSWNRINLHHVKLDARNVKLFNSSMKGQVDYIEPNFIYHAMPVRRNIVVPTSQWGLKAIDASKAWEIEQGNPTVKVAVIDTGIDCTHIALKNNCIKGWDFVTNLPNGIDDNMHGTHCAGIIAANSIKAMGIAPRVSVMAVKFLDADGGGSLDRAISSIEYAVKNKSRILSNSWGGSDYSQALRDVIKMAGDNGVLFIAAAGNESTDNDTTPSYPASFDEPNIISVAATDINTQMAVFSNFGLSSVHVGAPGTGIYSTTPRGKYETLSGTSMATPFVAGVAALILSRYPDATMEEIKSRILNNVSHLNSLSGKISTGGIINALNSL